jgi:hypothetical protein
MGLLPRIRATTMTKAREILEKDQFRNAVMAVHMRAEKQTNWNKLSDVFVKTELYDRVLSSDSQLILGRRGIGKTHWLRAYEASAFRHGQVAYYIDCTSLDTGSSLKQQSPGSVALDYLTIFLNELGTRLLDEIGRSHLVTDEQRRMVHDRLVYGGLLLDGATAAVGAIPNYRQVADTLSGILRLLNVGRLCVILDEWSRIPIEAQPYFAEHLKRCILVVPEITLKVAAVNYQCSLMTRVGGNSIGLERGADIPVYIEMDRYLVWDDKKESVVTFFGQLLYNHLGIELVRDLTLTPEEKLAWVEGLFTQRRAFDELVRAAEGNPRDFLCIFSQSYLDGFKQTQNSHGISIPNVTQAAASWYDETKAKNIRSEPDAMATLSHLMNEVLKGYKARAFMVEQRKAEHPRLTQLLNARILHQLSGDYSHPHRPGERYVLFAVDYGAFVRLRGTQNEIREEAYFDAGTEKQLSDDERKSLVPLDDKRSVRRITFDPDTLVVSGYKPEPEPGETANSPKPTPRREAFDLFEQTD